VALFGHAASRLRCPLIGGQSGPRAWAPLQECYNRGMADCIRIIRHEAVRSPVASRFDFQMAGNPGSSISMMCWPARLRPELFTSEDALEHAKAFARAGRDKDGAHI
jgi:hypothetical protein